VEAIAAKQQYINSADLHRFDLMAIHHNKNHSAMCLGFAPQDLFAFFRGEWPNVASFKPLAWTVRHCIFRGEALRHRVNTHNGQTLLAYSDVADDT